ncbi:MAG: mannosyltransferase [Candidatus Woesearchaeota archaeon]|nr:MAG: mannosyltransferase [Candidatus Woesearchaeota archaeon]
MKVLHLGKLCPPNEGGIEIFSYDLLEYLNSKGIKADLLCFGSKTAKSSYKGFDYFECKMNIKVNSAPLSYDFIKIFKRIEREYDIIHIHSPNPLAEFLSLFTDKKIIIHWHSDIVKQKISYRFYKPIQQKVLKKAHKIICTSPQYLETSKQLRDFKENAVIIPLGLNPSRLKASNEKVTKSLKAKIGNKKIVLSIGRLIYYKGFEYLIKAGKYIKDDVAIVIVGGGPLYENLKDMVKALNLENKVYLLGRVDKISFYIKESDLFCLPSVERTEAFGLVLVEALYFGKPLITTNVEGSGMNYVNQDGITGLVVPPRNPKALADAINKILSDNNLYERFSKNARERFKEFDISSIGDKIVSLYEEVLR